MIDFNPQTPYIKLTVSVQKEAIFAMPNFKQSLPDESNNRAALYVRVSTEDQSNEGYGIEVQLERCKAQAIANGLKVVEIFEDRGISGTKNEYERPGLAALVTAVENDQLDHVIVLSLDRLGRKTTLVLNLVERITSANVALISVKENLNTSTAMGQFVLTILAGLAQLERDTIVERTTAGRDLRGKIDGEKGGKVPFGYRRVSDGIEVRDDHAAIVRHIFALRRQGLTLRAIAEILNTNNVPSATGKQWIHTAVKTVLVNEYAYKGGKRGVSSVEWPVILEYAIDEAM
jgi:site-specific DNA recombinase